MYYIVTTSNLLPHLLCPLDRNFHSDVQEQRPSGALLLPGCRVEEREEGETCLAIVRPDNTSLLLQAEVGQHLSIFSLSLLVCF